MTETDKLLNEAMLMLAREGAIFMGQGVAYPGHAMYKNLEGVPAEQRIELPVLEEMQLGMACGMAMMGLLPVTIYPRMDFLLRAADQLVNHLDKMEQMSCGQWKPRVIIRTRVGSEKPLNAGPQHTRDHTEAFRSMLGNVRIVRLTTQVADIIPTYREAMQADHSTLVVEAF